MSALLARSQENCPLCVFFLHAEFLQSSPAETGDVQLRPTLQENAEIQVMEILLH